MKRNKVLALGLGFVFGMTSVSTNVKAMEGNIESEVVSENEASDNDSDDSIEQDYSEETTQEESNENIEGITEGL